MRTPTASNRTHAAERFCGSTDYPACKGTRKMTEKSDKSDKSDVSDVSDVSDPRSGIRVIIGQPTELSSPRARTPKHHPRNRAKRARVPTSVIKSSLQSDSGT